MYKALKSSLFSIGKTSFPMALDSLKRSDIWNSLSTPDDIRNLINGERLTDRIIYVAQSLLKKQFPHINGFQDTLLCQTNSFKCLPHNSIQIHHVDNCHWITSTSIGGRVKVCDSLYNTLSQSTIDQVTQCYFSNGDVPVNIYLPSVQVQKGLKDCGLFAIAFGYEIAIGNVNRIGDISFNQHEMREHLLRCLEREKLSSFPRIVTDLS